MKKPGASPPGFFYLNYLAAKSGKRNAAEGLERDRPIVPGLMRRTLRCSAGVFQRGDKVFRALALEFFLGSFEVCNAACDFFPLAREVVLRFGHAHPF